METWPLALERSRGKKASREGRRKKGMCRDTSKEVGVGENKKKVPHRMKKRSEGKKGGDFGPLQEESSVDPIYEIGS